MTPRGKAIVAGILIICLTIVSMTYLYTRNRMTAKEIHEAVAEASQSQLQALKESDLAQDKKLVEQLGWIQDIRLLATETKTRVDGIEVRMGIRRPGGIGGVGSAAEEVPEQQPTLAEPPRPIAAPVTPKLPLPNPTQSPVSRNRR